MTSQASPHLEAAADDTLAGAFYEPEDVTLLDTALALTCEQVSARLAIGEGIRSLLAFAILEGARSGLRDPGELASFALRALPSFRASARER